MTVVKLSEWTNSLHCLKFQALKKVWTGRRSQESIKREAPKYGPNTHTTQSRLLKEQAYKWGTAITSLLSTTQGHTDAPWYVLRPQLRKGSLRWGFDNLMDEAESFSQNTTVKRRQLQAKSGHENREPRSHEGHPTASK